MFKLRPPVLEQYRRLRYKPDAQRQFSMIPFGAYVWEDEHPGGKCMMPDLDDQSRDSILRLVAARTALWLHGEIPGDLEQSWEEARKALPNWPGFARLSISEREKDMIGAIRSKMDSFEKSLRADADEFSKSEDGSGVVRVGATYDLTKPKDSDVEDDV